MISFDSWKWHPAYLFTTELRLFVRIGSLAQNENLETPDILKSLKMSYFFQVAEDSTYVCKKNDLNSLKSNKTQINQFS